MFCFLVGLTADCPVLARQKANAKGNSMQSIMQKRNMMVLPTLMLAAGCAISPSDSSDTANAIGNVPESVVALAAPDQDVSTARLRPGDGCYWYEHNGPVEVTLLPLRTANGNPICAARPT